MTDRLQSWPDGSPATGSRCTSTRSSGSSSRWSTATTTSSAALSDLDLLRDDNLQLTADHLHLTFLLEELETSAAAAAAGRESASPEVQGRQNIVGGDGAKEVPDPDPEAASPGGSDSGGGKGATRGGLPKSISIRSRGFLAVKQPLTGEGREATRPHRLRLRLLSSPALKGEERGGEVEVDVYSQGMAKTELCNKWGKKGWCPYGERCQFAHGIQELRPVIRHPRYKTQLCRMLGFGVALPRPGDA